MEGPGEGRDVERRILGDGTGEPRGCPSGRRCGRVEQDVRIGVPAEEDHVRALGVRCPGIAGCLGEPILGEVQGHRGEGGGDDTGQAHVQVDTRGLCAVGDTVDRHADAAGAVVAVGVQHVEVVVAAGMHVLEVHRVGGARHMVGAGPVGELAVVRRRGVHIDHVGGVGQLAVDGARDGCDVQDGVSREVPGALEQRRSRLRARFGPHPNQGRGVSGAVETVGALDQHGPRLTTVSGDAVAVEVDGHGADRVGHDTREPAVEVHVRGGDRGGSDPQTACDVPCVGVLGVQVVIARGGCVLEERPVGAARVVVGRRTRGELLGAVAVSVDADLILRAVKVGVDCTGYTGDVEDHVTGVQGLGTLEHLGRAAGVLVGVGEDGRVGLIAVEAVL